ncbi:hypothetical protein MTO96_021231 [Rhipicephalus appendiculatus]
MRFCADACGDHSQRLGQIVGTAVPPSRLAAAERSRAARIHQHRTAPLLRSVLSRSSPPVHSCRPDIAAPGSAHTRRVVLGIGALSASAKNTAPGCFTLSAPAGPIPGAFFSIQHCRRRAFPGAEREPRFPRAGS